MSLEDTLAFSDDAAETGTWFRSKFAPFMVHLAATLTCVLLFVWNYKYHDGFGSSGEKLFNLHPLLLGVAVVFFVPESVLILRSSRFTRAEAKPIHAFLHFIAVVLAISGLTVIVKHKNEEDQPQFRSLHSWFGLLTFILLLGQWFMGYIIFYRLKGSIKSKLAPIHLGIGHSILFFSALTVMTGIMERSVFSATCSSSLSSECYVVNFTAISAAVTFLALGFALTAVKRAGASMLPAADPLLNESRSMLVA